MGIFFCNLGARGRLPRHPRVGALEAPADEDAASVVVVEEDGAGDGNAPGQTKKIRQKTGFRQRYHRTVRNARAGARIVKKKKKTTLEQPITKFTQAILVG